MTNNELVMTMDKVLVCVHTEADGSLARPALEAVGAAKGLTDSLAGVGLVVGFIGENVQKAAHCVASCGAARFLAVMGADFAQPRYASDAAAAEAIGKAAGASIIIVPHTSRWSRVLAGVARRLGGRVDSHVTAMAAAKQ